MSSPALSILALAGALSAQQIVVPPACTYFDPGTSTATWRSTAFHFQMMYDNTNFTGAGVSGPVTINRLRFRATDQIPNLGGQVFTGATIRLHDTPMTTATVASLATSATASTTTVIQTTGLVASQYASGASDAQRCFSITFTSGVNIGVTRIVSANTATSITVSLAFPAIPGVGDTFDVVRAPITFNNMAQAFAVNVGANVGAVETLGPVTVLPAAGSVPNNYVIDIPLTTAAFTYDPATMGNLVIDITAPTAPAPNATSLCSFGTSAVAATSRARRNSTATVTAATGALSDFASIVLMDFTGPGGSPNAALAAEVIAYGAGCNQTSPNLNQYFGFQDFDLRGPGKSLQFIPDNPVAPVSYTVVGGTTAVDLTQAIGTVNATDEGVVAHTPAWSAPFTFPGGSTTTLSASSNGFVWLGTSTVADFSPSIAEWLGGGASNYGARFAAFWHDFNGARNTVSHPGSGMYVNTDTSGGAGNAVTYVTWKETGEFSTVSATGGHSVNTFQIVLFEATRVVEIRYGACALMAGNGIAGFTRGGLGGGVNCADAGSRDLSHEVPFSSNANGTTTALAVTTSARPILGTSATFTGANIPLELGIGLFLYDIAALQPGFPVPGITEPGCIVSVPLSPSSLIEVTLPAGATVTSAPLAYPANFGLLGLNLYVQFAFWRAGSLTAVTSNGLKLTLGQN
ncbi:MAG: hypothetical protein WAT39_20245 [Planctomycetota bacterium]